MDRYLAFAGPTYYPEGGWGDYVGCSDVISEAQSIAFNGLKGGNGWFQVVDSHTGQLIQHGIVAAEQPK